MNRATITLITWATKFLCLSNSICYCIRKSKFLKTHPPLISLIFVSFSAAVIVTAGNTGRQPMLISATIQTNQCQDKMDFLEDLIDNNRAKFLCTSWPCCSTLLSEIHRLHWTLSQVSSNDLPISLFLVWNRQPQGKYLTCWHRQIPIHQDLGNFDTSFIFTSGSV